MKTKYGRIKTDHILFMAAGAFHVSKPSDLIPELQGRFPIRVELKKPYRGGSAEDFNRAAAGFDPAVHGAFGNGRRHSDVYGRFCQCDCGNRICGEFGNGRYRCEAALYDSGAGTGGVVF